MTLKGFALLLKVTLMENNYIAELTEFKSLSINQKQLILLKKITNRIVLATK